MEFTAEEIALIEGLRKHEIKPAFIASDAHYYAQSRREKSDYSNVREGQYREIREGIRRTYTK